MHYKVLDEITYPFLNFINDGTVEGREWISNPIFYWACDYVSMPEIKLIRVSKRGHWCFVTWTFYEASPRKAQHFVGFVSSVLNVVRETGAVTKSCVQMFNSEKRKRSLWESQTKLYAGMGFMGTLLSQTWVVWEMFGQYQPFKIPSVVAIWEKLRYTAGNQCMGVGCATCGCVQLGLPG